MKCQRCHGTGKITEWVATDTVSEYEFPCRKCNGKGEIEVTNEEYIGTCSTEELAKVISDLINEDYWCTEEDVLAWLKEEHNE